MHGYKHVTEALVVGIATCSAPRRTVFEIGWLVLSCQSNSQNNVILLNAFIFFKLKTF